MNDSAQFTMTPEMTKRILKSIMLGTLIAVPMLFFLGLHKQPLTLFLAVLISVGFFLLLYVQAKRRVYLRLDAQGISGYGSTGRKVHIPWGDAVAVEEEQTPQHLVVVIHKKSSGTIDNTLHAIRVPKPIVEQAEAKLAIKKYAPVNHPLLALA